MNMRTLLINLTRLGDLLQMQPLVNTLHAQGHIVDILCLENFQEAAKLMQGIRRVYPFPSSRILALANKDWRVSLAFIEENFENMLTCPYERVINMTSSMAARMIALRLAAKNAVMDGYIVDAHGKSLPASLWGGLFENAGKHRMCSPFNIVDAFAKSIHAFRPASPSALIQADEGVISSLRQTLVDTLSPTDRAHCQGFIAIQLGASAAMRQWPATSFAELGKQVWEKYGLMPLLLGTKNEQILAEAYLATGAPACNYVGQSSLQKLAELLACTRLLLTNDTGTMHLAAGLGIPCLAFFLATAQAWDTGPASDTSCIIEPALACHPCSYTNSCKYKYKCLQHITAEHVWPLLDTWLETGAWQSHAALNAVARVWQSVHDEKGYRTVRSLSGHEHEDRTIWLRVQQHVYSQFLDNLELPREQSPHSITPYIQAIAPCTQATAPCTQAIAPCTQTITPCTQTITPCTQTITPCTQAQHPFSEAWKKPVLQKIQKTIRSCKQLLKESKQEETKQEQSKQLQATSTFEKSFAANFRAIHTSLQQVDELTALALIWQGTNSHSHKDPSKASACIEQFIQLLQALEASVHGTAYWNGTESA